MNKNPNTPQTLDEQLLDLKAMAEKANVMTPEIERYLREQNEKLQTKIATKQKLTKTDFVFMEEVKEMIEKEKFLKIDIINQYDNRLDALATFGLIKSPKSPIIEGVDGKKYQAPTIHQIMSRITPEKADLIRQHIKNPLLLVTPFALPLDTIKRGTGQNKGKQFQNPIVFETDVLNAENAKHLYYFPETYDDDSHGGYTKSQLLEIQGGINSFPGWQVLVVDSSENLPKKYHKISASSMKSEFDKLGLSGLTPEDWLILHSEGILKGVAFDDCFKSGTAYHLAAYVKGWVPTAYWSSSSNLAELWAEPPNGEGVTGEICARPAVRF